MYAETAQRKNTSGRIVVALLCGLAVCCSVMYLSADADAEYMHEMVANTHSPAGTLSHDAGTSVGNVDVLKAGQVYTDTPNGNMRLMDYFNDVEKEISNEITNRKSDIAAVRAAMARDMAFNAGARAKLQHQMLHKMAENAKIARRNLDRFMRHTQMHMARVAAHQNARNNANNARMKRMHKIAKADAAEAASHLKNAVAGWQKATNAWHAKTNARIDKLNTHVRAHAALIKENAKRASKDLADAMDKWQHKVTSFSKHEAAANSKLGAQFAAQSKATRAWANNKIKAMVAKEGAQFADVKTKMAHNREAVDIALKQAAMRFSAALNAQSALDNKQFTETMSNIAAMKKATDEKVKAMSSGFKVQLLSLKSEVTHQITKANDDIDKTAGVIRSNAARNAKRNAHVQKEMTNMIKLGNDRYAQHLKDDAELQKAIGDAKDKNDAKLDEISARFTAAINKVQKELKAQRKHAHDSLKKQTGKLFAQLYKNEDAQAKKNEKMAADTRRMELDAMDALRKAKKDFIEKIFKLSKVVKKNDVKADAKIKELTGIVTANAAKSKTGREAIAQVEESNKKELKTAIADAIKKGEDRASAVEAKGAKMDKDTKWLVNNNLDTQIAKLRTETNAGVEALALQSAEARAEMRKEMLYAIRSAANVADMELKEAIKDGEKAMQAFDKKVADDQKKSKKGQKALKAELAHYAKDVARQINDAVATDARAQLALKTTQMKAIKKTNTNVAAQAEALAKVSIETKAKIKAMVSGTLTKIAAEEKRAEDAVTKFKSADAARQAKVLKFLRDEISAAEKKADAKFGDQYNKLAEMRKEADEKLASDVITLNDALAKQSALSDSRFEKTVKNVEEAKKQVFKNVKQLRKDLTSSIVAGTSALKLSEESIKDEIAVVSAEASTFKAQQAAVNRHVAAELKRVEKLSNDRFTKSKRARGQLRRIMNDNKMAAAAEVKALYDDTTGKLTKLRSKVAAVKREMAKDLSKATESWYEALGKQGKADAARTKQINGATQAAVVAAENDVKRMKEAFVSKVGMLTNTVAAEAKKMQDGITEITGVVTSHKKAAAADRANIKSVVTALEQDLHKSLRKAISIGTANAKATAQRIAEHEKNAKRYLQVELVERVEAGADAVMSTIESGRQKIADNYLSLKAYAIAMEDKVSDEVEKGKGRALSSIGDLLITVGSLKDVPAGKAEGLGFGGTVMDRVFDGTKVKVSGAVASINALVNEYTKACGQVRMRYPMGLGKYLMDRLEMSMMKKGVLQVDKIEGKHGNFVYINGRAVGLSNKLNDFANLAARMNLYEDALSKLTASLALPPSSKKHHEVFMSAPEWEGN
jgi:hypothetical protein